MDKTKNKLMDLVTLYIRAYAMTDKFKKVYYNFSEDVEGAKEYLDYDVDEFIQIYKIARLYELEKISESEYKNLKDLFNAKMKLLKLIYRPHFLPENTYEEAKKIKEIWDRIHEIDKMLEKYNLNIKDIDIKDIIDAMINSENYDPKTREELENFSGKIREREKENN